MAFSQDELQKVAHLARLELSEAAQEKLTAELGNILSMIETMNEVDTTDVAPLAHPTDATARLRADEVTEPNQREAFQAIAPETTAGLYLVPQVIGDSGEGE